MQQQVQPQVVRSSRRRPRVPLCAPPLNCAARWGQDSTPSEVSPVTFVTRGRSGGTWCVTNDRLRDITMLLQSAHLLDRAYHDAPSRLLESIFIFQSC